MLQSITGEKFKVTEIIINYYQQHVEYCMFKMHALQNMYACIIYYFIIGLQNYEENIKTMLFLHSNSKIKKFVLAFKFRID